MRYVSLMTTTWIWAFTLTAMLMAQEDRLSPVDNLRSNPPGTVALLNATIVTEPGTTVTDRVLLIRDGKIVALVPADKIPAGAKRIDLTGKRIYPAFVEPFWEAEHNGGGDPGLPYWNSLISPQRSMKDGMVLDEASLEKLRRAGIATAAVVPRDRIIKGTSCIITTGSKPLADRLLKAQWAQHVRLTTAGIRSEGYPNSPMGAVALARQAMLDAQWYHQAWQAYQRDTSLEQPEVCDALDVLSQQLRSNELFVFDGLNELFVLRADDFAREFQLNYLVRGSGREYLRLDAIAKMKRPILVPVNFPKAPNVSTSDQATQTDLGDLMHWELAPENPARLSKAGVTMALTSFGLRDPAEFVGSVRRAIERGLPAEEALKAVTTTPAKLLGVDELVGTIHSGKWANLIVTDKELWDKDVKIHETWVQGDRFPWETESNAVIDGTWRLDLQNIPGKPAALWLEVRDSKKRVAATLRSERDKKKEESGNKAGDEETKSADSSPQEASSEAPAETKESNEKTQEDDSKSEKKSGTQLVKIDDIRWQDRQLVGRFKMKQVIQETDGIGQLTLTLLANGNDQQRMVGRIAWSDGSVSIVQAVFDAELSKQDSESDKTQEKSEEQKDGANDDKKDKDDNGNSSAEKSEKITPVLSSVRYPLTAVGLGSTSDAPQKVMFRNATVWTCGAAGILENCDVLVEDGIIKGVGKALELPADAQLIDATGLHLSPGIIDCHSHMATDGGVNESGQAVTAEVRIGDFIDCNDISIYRQLAGGVTAANILHGSANPIGGQNQVIKLRWGALPNEMKMIEAPSGIKFALGENVKRSNAGMRSGPVRYPASRMGVEQILRDQFAAALDYEKSWREWEQTGNGLPPRRDLQSEAILEIIRGQRWVHCHSYRQDEILAFLRVLEDYKIRVGSLQHILEGYKVAEVLASHGAMASSFSDWWAYKFEVFDAIPHNGALMQQQGIVVSFNSDDDELARHLNHEAAKAIKYGGVKPEEALKFVTLNPAKQLRIDKYVGSIEVGKQADIVLWSQSPLSTMSRCEQTWIDGRKYFDRQQDLAQRASIKELQSKLVQKVLDSGAEMLGPGESVENPAGVWARHDEFCHAKGIRHQQSTTHQHR